MKYIRKLDNGKMRQNNVRLIFETLHRERSITRAGLAEKTRISAMNVGRIVDSLIERGLVTEHIRAESGAPGRPGINLMLCCENLLHFGVTLDPEGMSAGLVDPYGKIHGDFRREFDVRGIPPEEALREVSESVQQYLTTRDVPVQTMGIAIPGLVDHKSGIVRISSQLGWRNVPAAELLGAYAGLPLALIENDAKARAWAENCCGISQAYLNSILVKISDGIGVGIMIQGDIYRGKNNMAGEIGHAIINTNTRLCECGQTGCLQATLTETAIVREARTVRPDISDISGVIEAYQRGEGWAHRLMEIVCKDILITINLLANSFASEALILCGSLVDNYPLIRTLINQAYESQQSSFLNIDFDLCYSEFGDEGDVIAAAMVSLSHMLKNLA